jgi:Tfp pilus assembly protein PilN|tara:strand:- start:730 stop:1296 length:567 start_codon:yes stop_codon:yes gene_type:complete
MNLIKINLNQTVSKAEYDFIEQEKKRWYLFISICSLFIIGFTWLMVLNFKMDSIIEQRTTEIETIIADTNSLKSSGKINLSKKDINNLYKLESKRIFWTEKLIALSSVTPDDMTITKIEFKGKKLFISALSNIGSGEKEFTVVENFMRKIDLNDEFNKDFKDIKFDYLDKEKSQSSELLSFKVEAKLR